MKLQTYK